MDLYGAVTISDISSDKYIKIHRPTFLQRQKFYHRKEIYIKFSNTALDRINKLLYILHCESILEEVYKAARYTLLTGRRIKIQQ